MVSQEWKLLRDPYYGELYKQHGLRYALEAGFFFDADGADICVEDSVDILCTPTAFLKPLNEKDLENKPCVLLGTGAYCPAHYGHIQMMDLAKEEMERQGFQVLGGYLSPGHDDYIKMKTGPEWIPIHQRIGLLYEAIGGRDWLSVDPWEGLFNQVAVNFTDVIVRLEAYLKHHLGHDIPVIYVFGGDNAYFAKTFDYKGHGIIIDRPGYTSSDDYLANPRIFRVQGTADISSTQIRTGFSAPPAATTLRLRIGHDSREQQVIERLAPRFTEIKQQQVSAQQQAFDQIIAADNIVSLDTEIIGGEPLGICRHYDVFGGRRLRYGNRPGIDLREQIQKFDFKRCTLFDDDIHSGGTMRYAKGLLESENIEVSAIVSLNIAEENEEIADARDFLFGFYENSGLVVELPTGLSRVPYLYPYVCPYLRASIQDPLEFSIEMWQLNAMLHRDSGIQIGNLPYLQNFAKCLRYSSRKLLKDICLEHIEILRSFKER